MRAGGASATLGGCIWVVAKDGVTCAAVKSWWFRGPLGNAEELVAVSGGDEGSWWYDGRCWRITIFPVASTMSCLVMRETSCWRKVLGWLSLERESERDSGFERSSVAGDVVVNELSLPEDGSSSRIR